MKKTFLTLLCAVIATALLTCFSPKPFVKYLPVLSQNAERITLFCGEYDGDFVESGCGKIVQCSPSKFRQTLQKAKNIYGVSYSVTGDENTALQIAKRLQMQNVTVTKCADVTTLCGDSPFLSGGVTVDGKKVNVQIACHNNVVTVGSPLILGSY